MPTRSENSSYKYYCFILANFLYREFSGGEGGVDLAKNRPGNLANRESEFRASLNEFTADRITSDSGQGFVFVRLSRAVIQK